MPALLPTPLNIQRHHSGISWLAGGSVCSALVCHCFLLPVEVIKVITLSDVRIEIRAEALTPFLFCHFMLLESRVSLGRR